MPLVSLDLDHRPRRRAPAVEALLADAESRIAAFARDRRGALPGFVPSDFARVHDVLETIARGGLAPDRAFCEWGSGFGVVASLATLLGFDACGIEIEEELVDRAEELASDHGLAVRYACGTFVPSEGQHLTDRATDFAWLSAGGADGHAELGCDPSDFGVVFAYPWPGEEGVVEELFDAFGAEGALLVTYNGVEDVSVRRRVVEARA